MWVQGLARSSGRMGLAIVSWGELQRNEFGVGVDSTPLASQASASPCACSLGPHSAELPQPWPPWGSGGQGCVCFYLCRNHCWGRDRERLFVAGEFSERLCCVLFSHPSVLSPRSEPLGERKQGNVSSHEGGKWGSAGVRPAPPAHVAGVACSHTVRGGKPGLSLQSRFPSEQTQSLCSTRCHGKRPFVESQADHSRTPPHWLL